MKQQQDVFRFIGITMMMTFMIGIWQTHLASAETQSPHLILWNLDEKKGQIPAMADDDGDQVYTVTLPVVKGSYVYRVAIGAEKKPIYGADGKQGGKPIPLALEENRCITFYYDATTHLITLQPGEIYVPERKVVLVGNLQDEFGHTGGQFGGEWDPAAETTRMTSLGNGFFAFTGTLPAGTYEYKIAINGSWAENYGQGGKQDGANILVTVKEAQEVTFYYHDQTHKIADSTWYTLLSEQALPRIVGELQTTLGVNLILQDDDFDQVYSLKIPVPEGHHSYRIGIGADASPVYGAHAEQDGDPVEFTLSEAKDISIFFDNVTHETFFDDGRIAEELMRHDTYSLDYRTPFEAVKTGQELTLRFHARQGDITKATLVLGKALVTKRQISYGAADQEYEMAYLETKTLEGIGAVDFWGVTLTLAEPGLYGYKFRVNDLKEYGDDAKSGGVGKAAFRGTEYFPLTVYAADFTTPEWMKAAIIYQIFPDRFLNGNPANDAAKTSARGVEPLALHDWSDLPAAPSLNNDPDGFWNNDFFGGDIEGIRQKLDYLQSLGVTTLYLNPIAAAASNHKYDTADYDQIDPLFGTPEEFLAFTAELAQRGMYLILDGVFNHVGDDSIYFDRYGKYPWVGAYEYWSRVFEKMNAQMLRTEDAKIAVERELLAEGQQFSPYNWQNWFTIANKQVVGRYDYQMWSGYDSLPIIAEPGPEEAEHPAVAQESELNNREWADYMLFDENSVAKRWFKYGISGWRLDVADEIDAAFWRAFRQELKAIPLHSGEAPVIIGETWHDASYFFLGDQFDSVMNYGFRHAVLNSFLLQGDAAGAEAILRSQQQNYPQEALSALMNLLGSHDTARVIYLAGGGEDAQKIAERDKNFDYELGKRRLKLAVIFQMGYPGVPAIYYGDEAGLFGAKDPDCRRPYPWGHEDQELLAHYRRVARIRTDNQTLFVHGDLATLYADGDVYAFIRTAGTQAAIIALNRDQEPQEIAITVQGKLNEAMSFTDQLASDYVVRVVDGKLLLTIPPLTGRILLSAP